MKRALLALVLAAFALGVSSKAAQANTTRYGSYGRMTTMRSYRSAKTMKYAYRTSAYPSSKYRYRATNAAYYGYGTQRGRGGAYARYSNSYGYGGYEGYVNNNSNVAWVPAPIESWQVENGYGGGWGGNATVLVNWPQRGGTCNIRYTEANEPFYKYRTSAGCDEVNHWVSSLQPGQAYRFEIAQDNWNGWSGPAIARAW